MAGDVLSTSMKNGKMQLDLTVNDGSPLPGSRPSTEANYQAPNALQRQVWGALTLPPHIFHDEDEAIKRVRVERL